MGQQCAQLDPGMLPVAPGSALAFGHTPQYREIACSIKHFIYLLDLIDSRVIISSAAGCSLRAARSSPADEKHHA